MDAAVRLGELRVRKLTAFLYQLGAAGEIQLGFRIVSAKEMTVAYSPAVDVPISSDELNTEPAVCTGQHRAVEVGQHPVAFLQINHVQRRCPYTQIDRQKKES